MTPRVELEDLVTAADIGRRMGVSRQRASQLADHDGFPDPLGKVGNYVVWRWQDVEKWARKNRNAAAYSQPVLSQRSAGLLFVTDAAEPGVVHVLTADGSERLGSAVAWIGTPIIELRPHRSGVTVVGGRYEGEITENTKNNWTLSSSRERSR